MSPNNMLKSIFENKNNYYKLTSEDKESVFFILNRWFSKKYPLNAYSLNNKCGDNSTKMDFWFHFFKNETKIPDQVYQKDPIKESPDNIIKKYLDVSNDELKIIKYELLIDGYEQNDVKDELLTEIEILKKIKK